MLFISPRWTGPGFASCQFCSLSVGGVLLPGWSDFPWSGLVAWCVSSISSVFGFSGCVSIGVVGLVVWVCCYWAIVCPVSGSWFLFWCSGSVLGRGSVGWLALFCLRSIGGFFARVYFSLSAFVWVCVVGAGPFLFLTVLFFSVESFLFLGGFLVRVFGSLLRILPSWAGAIPFFCLVYSSCWGWSLRGVLCGLICAVGVLFGRAWESSLTVWCFRVICLYWLGGLGVWVFSPLLIPYVGVLCVVVLWLF